MRCHSVPAPAGQRLRGLARPRTLLSTDFSIIRRFRGYTARSKIVVRPQKKGTPALVGVPSFLNLDLVSQLKHLRNRKRTSHKEYFRLNCICIFIYLLIVYLVFFPFNAAQERSYSPAVYASRYTWWVIDNLIVKTLEEQAFSSIQVIKIDSSWKCAFWPDQMVGLAF